MKRFFKFFPDQPAYEEEFRHSYQAGGANAMVVGAGLGALVFFCFWVLDALNLRDGKADWFDGVQTQRVAIMSVLLGIGLLAWRRRDLVVRHYTVLAHLAFGLGVQAATYIAYSSRLNGTGAAEVYWAVTASTATGMVIAYGASRLPAVNSLILSSLACVAAVVYASQVPSENEWFIWRLIVHVWTVNIVCFFLRRDVEKRERELFLSFKEQLRSDERAKALEEARTAAENADRAKANFLASMSHEIRTPMHGLLRILELIKSKDVPQEVKELARVGLQSGKALLGIHNSILDYTATAAGKLRLQTGAVDLAQLAKTVEALHGASARAKSISFKVSTNLRGAARHVHSSQSRLLELVNNLVSNAIKFTDQGRVELQIGAEATAEGKIALKIVVIDSGIGIPKEALSQLFTPFFQVDQSLSRRKGGTGLGLALSKKVVEHLGGSIEIESVVGLGTVARVALLLEPAEAGDLKEQAGGTVAFPAEDSEETVESGLPGDALLRGDVLLVEDNHLNVLLALDQLKALGLHVEVAPGGEEAVRAFEQKHFNVVLMDCQMPGVDGLEATRRIRRLEAAQPQRGHTPIIGWTAHLAEADKASCLSAGMDDCLVKPHAPGELERKLDHWLSQSAGRAESEP